MAFLRQTSSWSCQELEVFAEYESIVIEPLITETRPVQLISGTYGPFRAGVRAEVPLWVAISLKTDQRCRIITPEWLLVRELEAALQAEKQESDAYYPLPFHYAQIATLLLAFAADDIRDDDGSASATRVEQLVADLENARLVKLSGHMKGILDTAASDAVQPRYKMDNGGDIELSYLKAGLYAALDEIVEMDEAKAALEAQLAEAAASSSMRSSLLGSASGGGGARARTGAAAAAGADSSFLGAGGGGGGGGDDLDEAPARAVGRLRAPGGFAGRLAAAAAAAGSAAGGGEEADER